MNGDNAVPSTTIIKMLNINKVNIIGRSQYFFLTFTNSQNSFKNSIFKIVFSLYYIGETILPKKIPNLNHSLFSGVKFINVYLHPKNLTKFF